MKRVLLLSLAFGLAGCATPQEQCIALASRDLNVVDRLISGIEGNLARGYAIAEVVVTRPEFVDCTPDPTVEVPDPAPRECLVDVVETVHRPVAIDLQAEAAKLASLKAKRSQLASVAAQAVAACQRQYPQ